MSENIQTTNTGQTLPCLQKVIKNDEYVLDKLQQAVPTRISCFPVA